MSEKFDNASEKALLPSSVIIGMSVPTHTPIFEDGRL